MRSRLLFPLGILLISVALGARAYLLWPFPGSQSLDSIRWAYFLSRWQLVIVALGALCSGLGALAILRRGGRRRWLGLSVATLWIAALSVGVFMNTAPRVFKPLHNPHFARGTSAALPPETLVMGIRSAATTRAYPLRLLAYHHQVRDVIGGQPILATY